MKRKRKRWDSIGKGKSVLRTVCIIHGERVTRDEIGGI